VNENFEAELMAMFDAFVDSSLSAVSGAEAFVWVILLCDTDTTGIACTDTADIARRSRLSVRTVRRAVASLEAKGLVRVAQRGRSGPHAYRVRSNIDKGK
jgi:DNA-binding MarR family transcriptional regulator